MITLDSLEQLASKLSSIVPGGSEDFKKDLKENFHTLLQASFKQLSLVTRDEFDRQSQALAKARQRLSELEQRINELESQQLR